MCRKSLLIVALLLCLTSVGHAAVTYPPPDAKRDSVIISPRHSFRVEYWDNKDIWLVATKDKSSRKPFLTPDGELGSAQETRGGGFLTISPDEKFIVWHCNIGHWVDELYLYRRVGPLTYVPCLDLQGAAYRSYEKRHHIKPEIDPQSGKEREIGMDTYDGVLGWSHDSRRIKLIFSIDRRPSPVEDWNCKFDVVTWRFF